MYGQLAWSSGGSPLSWQWVPIDIGGVIGSIKLVRDTASPLSANTWNRESRCYTRCRRQVRGWAEFQSPDGKDTAVSVVHILIGRLEARYSR